MTLPSLDYFVSADGVLRSVTDVKNYARDCWPRALWWDDQTLKNHTPSTVVKPKNVEEISALLRQCSKQGIPVVPRGGGSGVLGAAIPSSPDTLVLDLTGIRGLPDIEAGTDSVLAAAGLFGDRLEEALNHRGLTSGHFPASLAISTVGGWVATDSWGQLSTAYGPFRDRILALDCVLPDGRIIRDEDPCGWIGSEGTLGVITAVRFRALPLQKNREFDSFEFRCFEDGMEILEEIASKGIKPCVLRLYDGLDRRLLGPERQSVTGGGKWKDTIRTSLLRLHGKISALAELPRVQSLFRPLLIAVDEGGNASGTLGQCREIALRHGAVPLGEAAARSWWETRYRLDFEKVETMRRAGCFADTLDVFAPWGKTTSVYKSMLSASRPFALAMAHASHITGEGCCFYFTLTGAADSDDKTIASYDNCWTAMIEACINAGGRPNHHHGVGLAKRRWARWVLGEERLNALERKKKSLDPGGIMNPHMVFRE